MLQESLDRAVSREASASERRLLVTDTVGELHERLRPHAELLREGAHDPLGLGAVPGLTPKAVFTRAAPVTATRPAQPQDHAVAHF